jgi:hypothetical protein
VYYNKNIINTKGGSYIMAKKEWEFKKITFEDMKEYIEEKAAKDKEWFKSVAIDENGKYQHLIAKKAFCERYMPDIIPVKKPKKETKADILANW